MPLAQPSPTGPNQRQLKVAETIRHQLAEWLMRGELHDPALDGTSVTVSEVTTSRDLKHATAYVALLGVEQVPPAVLSALNRAGGRLGGRLARALHLKYAPRLRFEPDVRYANAARIDAALRQSRTESDHGG